MLDEAVIQRTLGAALRTGGEFAEVFVEDKRSSAAMLDDGRVEELSSGRDRGAGIRVVVGETTGFAHTADLSEDGLRTAAEAAAAAARSGGGGVREVAVLGTPRLIAACEEATVSAIAGHVPPGHTTVGMRVQLDHLAPTPVGGAVTAEARLDKIEGRRLTFSVSASDDRGLIAAGKVTRVVVDVDKFMDKCT